MHLAWQHHVISVLGILTTLLSFPTTGTAQSSGPSGIDPSDIELPPTIPNAIEQNIPTPSELNPSFPTELPTPRVDPNLQIPETPKLPETSGALDASFFVKTIQVLGNTVLKPDIEALVQGYENRAVTFSELVELRTKITQLYIQNGYVTSGAFILNNQEELNNGIVQIQVVEGEIERIEIVGLGRLRQGYIRDRINLGTDAPLKREQLETALKLLQLDPLVKKINAELTAGSSPGRNVLLVTVTPAPAFQSSISFDNYRAPSIGTLQGTLEIAHNNVLGFGDRFHGEYGITEGLNIYDLSYTFPINARNGSLGVRFSNSDSEIINEVFRDLGIRSDSQTLSFNLRQPITRTPESEFALGLSFDLRRSRTFILDDLPFSFSPGPDDGESKVRALRFSQDWINRQAERVLAARSQFNFGLNIFDATVNETGPSADFFSWLGQFQWVQRLSSRNLLVTQLSAQLTPDSLLPLEKFSIGGIDTIRGYTQNQLLADNGILASIEFRLPLLSDPNRLQLTPFLEAGTVWNNSEINPNPSTLASLGLGVRWQIYQGLNARLDFGLPLIDANNQGNSLQEAGLYFSLRYSPPGF